MLGRRDSLSWAADDLPQATHPAFATSLQAPCSLLPLKSLNSKQKEKVANATVSFFAGAQGFESCRFVENFANIGTY